MAKFAPKIDGERPDSRVPFDSDRATIARLCGVDYEPIAAGVWGFDIRSRERAAIPPQPTFGQVVADSRAYCHRLAQAEDEEGELGVVQQYARAAGF